MAVRRPPLRRPGQRLRPRIPSAALRASLCSYGHVSSVPERLRILAGWLLPETDAAEPPMRKEEDIVRPDRRFRRAGFPCHRSYQFEPRKSKDLVLNHRQSSAAAKAARRVFAANSHPRFIAGRNAGLTVTTYRIRSQRSVANFAASIAVAPPVISADGGSKTKSNPNVEAVARRICDANSTRPSLQRARS